MFVVNGMRATLRKYNRRPDKSKFYDDKEYIDQPIKLCPYNVDLGISFSTYTTKEAKGYIQVHRLVDIREGDQILFKGNTYTVLEVQEAWLFNRVENKAVAVK